MTLPQARSAPSFNALSFRFLLEDLDPDEGDGRIATLRPVVDDVDLLNTARLMRGCDPDDLLRTRALDLMPLSDGRDAAVGVCTCGELGCGSFRVRVSRDGNVVRWSPSSRAQTVDQAYVFELVAYLDALEAARALRPHEGRGRRIANAISSAFGAPDGPDRPLLHGWIRIEWVSAWPWTSDTVRACIEPTGGEQEVLDLDPLAIESDEEAARRMVDLLVKLSLSRPGA